MLQQLYADADLIFQQTGHTEPIPSMYAPKHLRWVVEIDPDLLLPPAFIAQGGADGASPWQEHLLPDRKRGSGIWPCLLADTPAYALGLMFAAKSQQPKSQQPKSQKADPQDKAIRRARARTAQKFIAFKSLLQECAVATGDADVAAIATFLDAWNPTHPSVTIPADMDIGQIVTFRVKGRTLAVDNPVIGAWWAARGRPEAQQRAIASKRNLPTRSMQCLLSGTYGPVEEVTPVLIKGVSGGLPTGTHLVCVNHSTAESYGLKRAHNSPLCRDAGERFGKALNALLASEAHHQTLQRITYVFWATPPQRVSDAPAFDAFSPTALPFPGTILLPVLDTALTLQNVQNFLEAVRQGVLWSGFPPSTRLHIFGLSACVARVVVRSAQEETLEEMSRAQAAWFTRLMVIGPHGQTGRPPSIQELARALYRDEKFIPPGMEESLVGAALSPHTHLPETLLAPIVVRCRVGSRNKQEDKSKGSRTIHVSYECAALLKYILTQHLPVEVAERMSKLDVSQKEAAYRCGRLLALLEHIQQQARGTTGATLVDRYYGGASTTPRTVFPALLRITTQAHLPQIRREQGSLIYHELVDEMSEILSPIGQWFPAYFTVREQGQFALGLYFQRAELHKGNAV